jgi:hypothetical protein
MPRPKSKAKLNTKPSEFIEENILLENPETLPEFQPVQVVREIPKMETIIFRNDRDPGYPLEFHYASATHPLKQYKLIHGATYTLPIEIIEHLERCCLPIYGYRRGVDGHPEMFTQSQKFLYQCKTVRDPAQRYAA